MKLSFRHFDLRLTHRWRISSSLLPGNDDGKDIYKVVFVELTDKNGTVGIGEAAPSSRYSENVEGAAGFCELVNPYQLSFTELEGSMRYVEGIAPRNFAAKAALNVALLDGAGRLAGKPIHELLGLSFTENKHLTSFTIGIDRPEVIKEKVLAAEQYPVLKLKVGSPDDRQNLAALREVAPRKTVRVDANEAWRTKEEALANIEWLASDGHVEFVEQPMPAGTRLEDLVWLRERSPLPLVADESYPSAAEASRCAQAFHAVNVKLAKCGGITSSLEALKAARQAGLKTMLGCMIESSLLITAAAHLADLTDYLDLDGNLLITNDPYRGVVSRAGWLSMAQAPRRDGLGVVPAPAN